MNGQDQTGKDGVEVERRKLDKALKSDLVQVSDNVVRINRALLIGIIVLITYAFGFGSWTAVVNSKVSEVPRILDTLNSYLEVLKNHGVELDSIRTDQDRLSGELAAINTRIYEKTKDRFTATDFRRWETQHLQLFTEITNNLRNQVKEHCEKKDK